jgi:hypothetical protein
VLRVLDKGGVRQLLETLPGYTEWLARLSLSAGGRLVTFDQAASQWRVEKRDIEQWLTKLNGTLVHLCGKEAFAVVDDLFGLGQF